VINSNNIDLQIIYSPRPPQKSSSSSMSSAFLLKAKTMILNKHSRKGEAASAPFLLPSAFPKSERIS